MTEDTLPPLPGPYYRHLEPFWRAEQIRAYGLSCYEAGRTEASRPEAPSEAAATAPADAQINSMLRALHEYAQDKDYELGLPMEWSMEVIAEMRAIVRAALAHPPKAPEAPLDAEKRQPLTEEQITDAIESEFSRSHEWPDGDVAIARVIERAHGIVGDQ